MTSHLQGTLTIEFGGPTNLPPTCHDNRGIVYTMITTNERLHSDEHRGIVYTVTAVPTATHISAGTDTVSASFPAAIVAL
jgi:hypothetical protein